MDSVFLLEDGARSLFLQNIVEFFGCSYICLWSYLPNPSNCLICMDGLVSSSMANSEAVAFDSYRKSVFVLDKNDHHVPGFAFKNGVPYLEFKELDLLRLSSNQTQLHFYMEGRIKTVIFMGCGSGEIELGMSSIPQVNMEMEMKNWFPTDFSRQLPYRDRSIHHSISSDQNIPSSSSSSSSLRSLSMDRPELSPLLFKPFDHQLLQAGLNQRQHLDFQLSGQKLSEHEIMTEAILAVLSSSSSSSSLGLSNQTRPSAFKRCGSSLSPAPLISTYSSRTGRRQDMLKRSISFFRTLNLQRIQEQIHGGRSSSNTQLQHMISERKRREKINESFQILRSLILPLGTKKDKASVLSSTIDYLTSLRTQISDLTRKNQILETILLDKPQYSTSDNDINNISKNERSVDVRLSHVNVNSTTSSQSRIVDLHVLVRGNILLSGMVTRLLEFVQQDNNVSLMSLSTEILMVESAPINRIILRLNINEDVEWDEGSFQEAVRRLVSDLAPSD
ncbi:putative transcription factor bHLH041 [Impatiens glandulifera]|uniref:putative transcription factor bHLH041 n=1 Tax=Impatiens glandulifera TaxID=253017 RepID=UPI001FB0CC30|nr:putative transcription factor bHLH041 [Impatiens glandulifera]